MVSLTPATDAVRKLYEEVRATPPDTESPDGQRIHNLTIDVTESLQLFFAASQDEGRDPNHTIHELSNALSNALLSVASSNTANARHAGLLIKDILELTRDFAYDSLKNPERPKLLGYQEVEEESQHEPGRA
jgi:hypothetical protein